MLSAPLTTADFAAAILRVGRFRDRPIVVKLGGSAMEDPSATLSCLQAVAVLRILGMPIVLVHGGGKAIDRAMAEAGLTPRKVVGRRYTDDATLEIVVRVLLDEFNTRIVRELQALGSPAERGPDLFGERLQLTDADGRAVDLGRVGVVTRVNVAGLADAIGKGTIPVIPSLARDAEGRWLNVNADTAASALAGALKASRAIFLTDTPGVLRDRKDPASLLTSLTREECRELIAAGAIDGGMVPKVEACFEALDAGASSALILDGRVPFSLLDSFFRDTFSGTTIVR